MYTKVSPSDWQRHVAGTVSIPREAHEHRCRCGTKDELRLDTLHVDEGDAGAMVTSRCPECRVETAHYWGVDDEEFEELFGYPFGQAPDEEDDTAR